MQSAVVPAEPMLWRGTMSGAPGQSSPVGVPNPESDLILKLAFGFFAIDLFLTVSRILEITSLAGIARIPYLGVTIHVVTMVLALISGGAKRVLASRVGAILALFTGWMMVCTLTSVWRGGSTDILLRQWLPSLIIFVSCGTVVTLPQCRKAATVLATATAVIAGASYALATLKDDRLAFEAGTLGNANELSMVLLLGAPFFLVPVFSLGSSWFRKVVSLALCAVVVVLVIRSASRSNLLAIVSILTVLFWTRPFAGKLKLGLLTIVLVFVFIAATPRQVVSRYITLFSDAPTGDDIANSAHESTAARQYLLQQSLRLTMEHPIFGVGPGIFTVGEADLAKSEGQAAQWHVSHNSYTQVSSEMGIPGLLLYLAALWGTLSNIVWFRRRSRIDPTGRASALGLALLLSLVGLCVNLAFSSNAYFPYLPILMGLSVVLRKSLQVEMNRETVQLNLPKPALAVPVKPAAASSERPVYRFLGRARRSGA